VTTQLRLMISGSITNRVCAAPTKAVETASAANILSLKREPVSTSRSGCSRTWSAIAILRCIRMQAGRSAFSLAGRSRESLCLTSPFIERGPLTTSRRRPSRVALSIVGRNASSQTLKPAFQSSPPCWSSSGSACRHRPEH